MKKLFADKSGRTVKVGAYSTAAALFVIAIAVVLNIFAEKLPADKMQLDITSNRIYSLSEQTEAIVSALDEDVTVYWIVQKGSEDPGVSTLLDRYAGLNSRIHVVTKDPDVFPTFVQKYVSDGVYNNSLIVESAERFSYVSYYDIYEYDYSNYYTTGSYSVNFAGEGCLTSAIDYVTSDSVPVLYILSGHGESELSSSYTGMIEKQNVSLQELSLIRAGSVPEDAGCVLVCGPQTDITTDEKDMLLEYLSSGGGMILITDPLETDASRPNLDALAEAYGMSEVPGLILENDSNYYAFGTNYYLLPDILSHAVSSPLINGGYYVMAAIAHGIRTESEPQDGLTVTGLLQTSSSAISKLAGYDMQTYAMEEGDLEGPFTLAAIAEDTNAGALVWFGSGAIAADSVNSQVSGGNSDLLLNCINYLCGEESGVSIHSKSMSSSFLTINSGTAALLTFVVVALIPLGYLVIGLVIHARRKRR